MRSSLRHVVVSAVLGASFLIGPGTAFATSGLIVVTGETRLSEDHHGNVWFAADSATLDCAGHAIVGPNGGGPWPLVGIGAAGRTNIAIRNCRVSGFVHGISFTGVSSFSIVGTSSTDNEKMGIALMDATHGVIVSTDASRNGWDGISGQNLGDVQLLGDSASANGQNGFELYTPWPQTATTYGIRFVGDTSVGNGIDGFHVDPLADGNTFVGNTARANVVGFSIGSASNRLTFNTASANTLGFITWACSARNVIAYNVGRGNIVLDANEYAIPSTNVWFDNWFGTTLRI